MNTIEHQNKPSGCPLFAIWFKTEMEILFCLCIHDVKKRRGEKGEDANTPWSFLNPTKLALEFVRNQPTAKSCRAEFD